MRKLRGGWYGAAAWALMLAAGCAEGGGAAVLPEGRYHYVSSHPVPQGTDTIRMEGVLVVTRSGDEGLQGRWDVPRMNPELRARAAEGGGLELSGRPTYFGTLVHTVRRDGGGYRCTGRYVWVAEGGEERTLPVTCTLATPVPPGVGVPDPE